MKLKHEPSLEKFSKHEPSLEKCVGHSLKILETLRHPSPPPPQNASPPLVSQAGYGPSSWCSSLEEWCSPEDGVVGGSGDHCHNTDV